MLLARSLKWGNTSKFSNILNGITEIKILTLLLEGGADDELSVSSESMLVFEPLCCMLLTQTTKHVSETKHLELNQ